MLKISHSHRAAIKQLCRYGVVGLINNAIGYGAYLLLTFLGMPYKIAMTLLYVTAVAIGFFAHRRWVFAHDGHAGAAALKFCAAHFCGYLLNLGLLFVFADHMGYPHQYVQAAAIFVVAAFLYITFKFIVFRQKNLSGTRTGT